MLGAGFAHGISIHFDTCAMVFSDQKYQHQNSMKVPIIPPSEELREIYLHTNFTFIQCTQCALFVSVFKLSRNPN